MSLFECLNKIIELHAKLKPSYQYLDAQDLSLCDEKTLKLKKQCDSLLELESIYSNQTLEEVFAKSEALLTNEIEEMDDVFVQRLDFLHDLEMSQNDICQKYKFWITPFYILFSNMLILKIQGLQEFIETVVNSHYFINKDAKKDIEELKKEYTLQTKLLEQRHQLQLQEYQSQLQDLELEQSDQSRKIEEYRFKLEDLKKLHNIEIQEKDEQIKSLEMRDNYSSLIEFQRLKDQIKTQTETIEILHKAIEEHIEKEKNIDLVSNSLAENFSYQEQLIAEQAEKLSIANMENKKNASDKKVQLFKLLRLEQELREAKIESKESKVQAIRIEEQLNSILLNHSLEYQKFEENIKRLNEENLLISEYSNKLLDEKQKEICDLKSKLQIAESKLKLYEPNNEEQLETEEEKETEKSKDCVVNE
ncbi:hypothetical protein AB837_00530 [bacterium AB1]|nr:hypothetical protein AB837_00530 [bacterium AB1]